VTTVLAVAVLGLLGAVAYEHAQVSAREQQALNTYYEELNNHRRVGEFALLARWAYAGSRLGKAATLVFRQS
jgi:hypothetical protein